MLRTILTRIRGQAYEVIRYEEITSWEMLKTLLKNTYDKPINAAYLQIELFSAKQRYKESLIEYATRIRNLVQAVSEGSTQGKSTSDALAVKTNIREQALLVFLEGINDKIKVMVKSKNPSTLEQAIQIAIIEDKNITPSEVKANNHKYFNRAKGEAQKYNKGNCHVCGKYGHYARDCRFKNGSPKNEGEERDSIERVCIDFMDIFHLEGDKLTHTTSIEHEIKTPEGEPPIYQRQYRLPHRQRDEITRQIKQMKSDGIIEPSNSPWNSPILLVPKKMDVSGKPKFRLVVDFRKLNNITVGDKMPLPQIQDVLDRLGRSKYFSVLDLAQGFHQISLDKESRVKTAFSSDIGHWQYTKLPMGLKNSPPTFQRLMNNVLCNLIGLKCLVYLDDIIVFSTDLSEHDKRIREVFSRLRTHNLKLQPIKCEFLRKEVIYLGHKLTEKGVQPDERKIKSVKTFPIPTTVKEIKSFLGLTGYYRNFVPDYGKIAKPITNLLRKGIEFIWTSECQEAFEKLKIILCNEPLLRYPDFEKPFIITCDASNYAVGCVLSQGVIPADLPIAYASRTLNKAEINY
ncbi:hypothetical protein QTP88_001095 [Uroleucon formosanum]